MKKYDIIAFDLDGTLTNPEHGLICSFVYALGKMGVDYGEKNELKRFIGPPIYEEWQKEFGFSPEESSEALEIFREFYSVYGWWDNEVYPGVPEMLKTLKENGKTVILATSKPEVFAKKVLKLFDIDKYFDFIGGAETDKTRDRKCDVLEYALNNIGCNDRTRVIMVGDRMFDAEGAAICGVDSLGVLYGHGSEEELKNAGFINIVKTVEDITNFLV